MKYPKAEQEEAMAYLHKVLKPGDTVICVLRSRSRSGMSRRIDFYTQDLEYLTHNIAVLGGYPRPDCKGLKVNGCGMDMGFNTVYNLGARMWPKGTDTPHGTRNGVPDSTGGYVLKHRWL